MWFDVEKQAFNKRRFIRLVIKKKFFCSECSVNGLKVSFLVEKVEKTNTRSVFIEKGVALQSKIYRMHPVPTR